MYFIHIKTSEDLFVVYFYTLPEHYNYYTQSLSKCQYSNCEYDKLFYTILKNSEETYMDYRTIMRNLREDSNLTQKEVGAVINKSQQGYSHIEDGRAELKIDDLIKLCRFYNVSADYFIGISDNRKR